MSVIFIQRLVGPLLCGGHFVCGGAEAAVALTGVVIGDESGGKLRPRAVGVGSLQLRVDIAGWFRGQVVVQGSKKQGVIKHVVGPI